MADPTPLELINALRGSPTAPATPIISTEPNDFREVVGGFNGPQTYNSHMIRTPNSFLGLDSIASNDRYDDSPTDAAGYRQNYLNQKNYQAIEHTRPPIGADNYIPDFADNGMENSGNDLLRNAMPDESDKIGMLLRLLREQRT